MVFLFKHGIYGEIQRDLCQTDRKSEADMDSLYLKKTVWNQRQHNVKTWVLISHIAFSFSLSFHLHIHKKTLKNLGFVVKFKKQKKFFKNLILREWNHLPINTAHAV